MQTRDEAGNTLWSEQLSDDVVSALLLLIPVARLRQFILEPDYVPRRSH